MIITACLLLAHRLLRSRLQPLESPYLTLATVLGAALFTATGNGARFQGGGSGHA